MSLINRAVELDNSQKLEVFDTDYQNDKVYKIFLEKVIEERCDELDYALESEDFEIIHREYDTVATSIFNYTVFFMAQDSD